MRKRKEEYIEIVKEAISYIKNVESLQELERQLGEELTDDKLSEISKTLIAMKRSNRAQNRSYKNKGQDELALETQIEFKEIKAIDEKFRWMRNQPAPVEERRTTNDTPRESRLEERRKKTISDIELINYWISDEAKEKFQLYKETGFYNERLSILKELQSIYTKALQEQKSYKKEMTENIYRMVAVDSNIKQGLPTSKKLIYAQMNKEEYSSLKEKLEDMTSELRKCHQLLECIIHLKELDNAQIKLLTNPELVNEELIENYDFIEPKNEIEKDFQRILRKLVLGKYTSEYSNMPVRFIPEEVKELLNHMLNLPEYELEELTILAIDVIKQKRKNINKEENRWEKAFLKNIEKEFIRIKPVFYEIEDEDTSVYYDILNKLMQDDRNYEYIKKLLEIEEFTKARTTYKEQEDQGRKKVITRRKEHIVLLVLDNFIKNYKLKLQNQGFDYIEPAYYKEIIKLFINKETELTQEEQDKYYLRLEEFKEYIKGKGYQSTEKVLTDIEEIETFDNNYEKSNVQNNRVQYFDNEQRGEIYEYLLNDGIIRNYRKGYPEFKTTDTVRTFQIEGVEPFAFSISYNQDGSKRVGIHVLDTTTIINGNEYIAKELECGYDKLPTLNTKREYPTMMFETTIQRNNNLESLKISPANIKIDAYYNGRDLDNYREIPTLKEFVNWLGLIRDKINYEENIYQESSMENIIESYLSETISLKLESEKIPFIYQSSLPNAEELILKNHNAICQDLYKIERKKAHQIFDIMHDQESKYYIPSKTSESRIEINPSTEEGIYLLNTIHRIGMNRYNPEEAETEVKELLEKLNEQHEYVPSSLEKSNEKGIKKILKAYQKKVGHA